MDQCGINTSETVSAAGINRRSVLLAGGAALASLLPRGPAGWNASAQEGTSADTADLFLVIRRYRLAPETTIAEVVQQTEQGFVPILRQISGFVAYYNVDLGNGEGATISLFSSQASAEESTAQAATWVQANLADLVAGPPEVMQGVVLLDVLAEEAGSAVPTS